ncbi:MAG TPA: flavodoxin domain-containing protein [Kofleriaceae bacterium]
MREQASRHRTAASISLHERFRDGGTEGIARRIADAMRDTGVDVALRPAREVDTIAGYDAAIIGGALYANRWHRDARQLVTRHRAALQRLPVWLFSSGPLDGSAARAPIPPMTEVAVLMERIGGGIWLPLALILAVTWATGAIMATLPWPKPAAPPSPPVSTHP